MEDEITTTNTEQSKNEEEQIEQPEELNNDENNVPQKKSKRKRRKNKKKQKENKRNNEQQIEEEEIQNYQEGEEEQAFEGIEFNPMELIQEMNQPTNNKKKRKKNNKNKFNSDNDEEEKQVMNQRAFVSVDERKLKNWTPPTKQWVKEFFEKSSTEINDKQEEQENNKELMNDEIIDTSLSTLDEEALSYILNVRYEAKNYCEQIVVAKHVNSRSFDNNRSSIKEIDNSLYETIHQFDPYLNSNSESSNKEETVTCLKISKEKEGEILEKFIKEREVVQKKIDENLRKKVELMNFDKSGFPALNSDYSNWKRFCLGEDNVYDIIDSETKKKEKNTENKKKVRRGGRKKKKEVPSSSTTEQSTELSTREETMELSSEQTTTESTTDSTKENNNEEEELIEKQEEEEDETKEKKQSKTPKKNTKMLIKQDPTIEILTNYLDYLTTHSLFSKLIHWTISNYHNNTLLRRKGEKQIEAENEEEEDKERQEKILNYLLDQSSESDNLQRCKWIYHLLLAVDKPPTLNVSSAMIQLVLWVLKNYNYLNQMEQEEFTKIVLIIVKYFGQGDKRTIINC